MRSGKVDLKKLEKWIGGDPYREALLIDEVPTSHLTIARMLKGKYTPSERLADRFNVIMARFPEGDPLRVASTRRKEPVGA